MTKRGTIASEQLRKLADEKGYWDFLRFTHEELSKWLREKHKIDVLPIKYIDMSMGWYKYSFDIYQDSVPNNDYIYDPYDTYEDAMEAGLLYALKTLK
jgi:hypothetical protein